MCSFLVWKNACFNYREFDLEGDLVGVPHTWYLSAQSFISLLKLVWREYDIVTMNELKKKCVGLQRTWVSKRTVCLPLTPVVWLCQVDWVLPLPALLSLTVHGWNSIYKHQSRLNAQNTENYLTYICTKTKSAMWLIHRQSGDEIVTCTQIRLRETYWENHLSCYPHICFLLYTFRRVTLHHKLVTLNRNGVMRKMHACRKSLSMNAG